MAPLENCDILNSRSLMTVARQLLAWCLGLFLTSNPLFGQIQVYQESPLSFGGIISSETGGTVSISAAGVRSSSAGIVLLGQAEYHPLILGIEAPYGSQIQIQLGGEQTLTGSNGGQLSLTLNESNPVSPFLTMATPPDRTLVYIGGTLSIGLRSQTPPGNYSGTLTIVLIQE